MWGREAFEPQGVGQGGVRVQVGCHNLHLIHDFGPSRGYRLQGRKEIIVKAARSCRRDVLYLWYCRKASLDFSYISRAWARSPRFSWRSTFFPRDARDGDLGRKVEEDDEVRQPYRVEAEMSGQLVDGSRSLETRQPALGLWWYGRTFDNVREHGSQVFGTRRRLLTPSLAARR